MSMTRVAVAGVLGGVAMFCWGAVSHMALGLGEVGMKNLPNEGTIAPAMQQSLNERGVYFFPPMEDESEAGQKAWAEAYKKGPRGLIVYDPTGSEPMSPQMLGAELCSNILCALIMAIVLANVAAGRGRRIALGTLLGAFAPLSISVSHWNWYRFPAAFMLGETTDQVLGGLVTAAVVALTLGRAGKAKPLIG